ncbi:alpha/beta hydrolase [Shewanella ulleungensis]|jgi:pimeloyl-ACP methyl ester carboxylesterase|uniref:Esterase n=1 Tax=Shewanella ulleungensis TaxID=2282699 RepID=A0ABQ2QQG3_9GAMM|nr:alpha/beta fold hydrolase [Shewanella ulleungensis]MCL1151473.1 lysophospholipase [Shewanella ulleungensis]GGP91215.1 esterase [Shewanella ulleungensis]
MRAIVIGSTKHLLFAAFYGAIGICVAILFTAVWLLNDRPDLSIWHTTHLTSEYHQQSGLTNFKQYLALEDKLFAEVDRKIYRQYQPQLASPLNRYERHSLSDPALWQQNWNRSFEWQNPQAEFGLLLLHGMSDSPYVMSHIAQHYQHQAHIVGLRLPGHGTVPSGLTDITWPDLAGAVSLAAAHLAAKLPGKPIYVAGFSTGAALALNHELENINLNKPTDFAGMIFLSPAIGLAPIAAGAYWQAKLGRLLGQDKLYWNSIQTEYDPFRYQSFAVNAGDVVYRLTLRNQTLLAGLTEKQYKAIAPILTFQSVVDDTVSSLSVVEKLYQHLPVSKGHELVLFDVNRKHSHNQLLMHDPLAPFAPFWLKTPLPYRLSLLENNIQHDHHVQVRELASNSNSSDVQALALIWPKEVYSLSHVALTFPIEDTLYGPLASEEPDKIQIGRGIYQGERGIFSVTAADMLRQKWNPFYPYMMSRMDEFTQQ